jgi:hypothetical protein
MIESICENYNAFLMQINSEKGLIKARSVLLAVLESGGKLHGSHLCSASLLLYF